MIPGLYYFENVLSSKFYLNLIKWLDLLQFENVPSRKALYFGYKFVHSTKEVDIKVDPIPPLLNYLQQIIFKVNGGLVPNNYIFNQCTINKYTSGEGIHKHIDELKYGPYIVIFTFISTGCLRFSLDEKVEDMILRPNSMLIMSGEGRYEWYHEICEKDDIYQTRYSIIFRSVSRDN